MQGKTPASDYYYFKGTRKTNSRKQGNFTTVIKFTKWKQKCFKIWNNQFLFKKKYFWLIHNWIYRFNDKPHYCFPYEYVGLFLIFFCFLRSMFAFSAAQVASTSFFHYCCSCHVEALYIFLRLSQCSFGPLLFCHYPSLHLVTCYSNKIHNLLWLQVWTR